MFHEHKLIIILLSIIFILYIVPKYRWKNEENMINIGKVDPVWDRNKCDYYMNESMEKVLSQNKIENKKDKWNFYFPCGYDYIDDEIAEMPIKEEARYFIIDNADEITAKNLLWENLVSHHGLSKAKTLSPDTFVLSKSDDIKRMKNSHYPGKLYILKKNIQRQEGLLITDNIDEILKKNDFILAQELLQNPYLIGGRKINLRVYVLTVCYKNNLDVYVYNNGFMYYTKDVFIQGNKTSETNITTGYVDRWIYDVNPLTHIDFKNYLDKSRKMTEIESLLVNQGYKLSTIIFNRINKLMSDVFISFKGKICRNDQKLYNNYTYQLFGADVAIDNELQPTIMEINKGPDLGPKDERDGTVKYNMVNDAHKILGAIPNDNNNGFIKVLDIEGEKIVFAY